MCIALELVIFHIIMKCFMFCMHHSYYLDSPIMLLQAVLIVDYGLLSLKIYTLVHSVMSCLWFITTCMYSLVPSTSDQSYFNRFDFYILLSKY